MKHVIAAEIYEYHCIPYAMAVDSFGVAVRAFPTWHQDANLVKRAHREINRVNACSAFNADRAAAARHVLRIDLLLAA